LHKKEFIIRVTITTSNIQSVSKEVDGNKDEFVVFTVFINPEAEGGYENERLYLVACARLIRPLAKLAEPRRNTREGNNPAVSIDDLQQTQQTDPLSLDIISLTFTVYILD